MHSESDLLRVITNLSAQVQTLSAKVIRQELELGTLKNDINKLQSVDGGSTYVRWGKKACPSNGTETVYSGYAAGSLYTSTGAAANYLCLSPDPLWAHYSDAVDSGAYVFGAEYEFYITSSDRYHGRPFFGKDRLDNDAPCSLCRTTRSAVTMIPGRNKCYDGWTLEYAGYLVAGGNGYHATEYVCLDFHPDSIVGGQKDENGALFYLVEGRCGSLECPPYVNGRELTCAVCSK